MGKITCEACKKKCKGQALRLPTDKFYHTTCFKCRECKKTLSGESYYSKNDSHYCKEDYQRLFVVRCVACGGGIEGEVVTALDAPYHPGCFKCSRCGTRIVAGTRVTVKDSMHFCHACDQARLHQNNKNKNSTNNNNKLNKNNINNNNINNMSNTNIGSGGDSNSIGGRPLKELSLQQNDYNNNVNNNKNKNNADDIQKYSTPKNSLLNANMQISGMNGGGDDDRGRGGGDDDRGRDGGDGGVNGGEGDGREVGGMAGSPGVVDGHGSHFINSPESDYSMELKNLTESSIDEALLPAATTPATQNGHHHHHHQYHHHQDHQSNHYPSTPGCKSEEDASFIETDAKQRSNGDGTMSCRCVSPESTFSRKSKDSSSSEPMRKSNTLNFGTYLRGSYLDKADNYKRSPSCNPAIKENLPLHYHRPQDFSYRKSRTDIRKPGRKTGMKFNFATSPTLLTATTTTAPYVPQKQQEAIQLSKQPDAQKFDHAKVAAIERDDFPAPPDPAATWPELLREHNLRCSSRASSRRGHVNGELDGHDDDVDGGADNDDDLEDVVIRRSRMEKDMKELSKLEGSGAAGLILKDMRNKRFVLDPRSASRTPSAAREPPFKTRFTSPVYASPSRDLLMRSQLAHYEEFEPKYRTCATPMPSSLGGKIDYRKLNKRALSNYHSQDLLSWQTIVRAQRPDSTDGCLESSGRGGGSSGGLLDAYSQYSSHSDYLDHDPITGLKCHRPSRYMFEGRCTPISVLSHQLCLPRDDQKTYEYERLRVTSKDRPSHLDEEHLEQYLHDDDFERLVGMGRSDFQHLPGWKQNDIKKRLELFQ